MDFNLRRHPGGVATVSNVDFVDPYGGSIALKKTLDDRGALGLWKLPNVSYAASGTYQSPPCDWTIPATLTDLTVAADLNGGQVTATIELSSDGFRTIASRMPVPVRDGVNVYSLESLTIKARSVRVRLDLRRGTGVATTPVVDGFQVLGKPFTKD